MKKKTLGGAALGLTAMVGLVPGGSGAVEYVDITLENTVVDSSTYFIGYDGYGYTLASKFVGTGENPAVTAVDGKYSLYFDGILELTSDSDGIVVGQGVHVGYFALEGSVFNVDNNGFVFESKTTMDVGATRGTVLRAGNAAIYAADDVSVTLEGSTLLGSGASAVVFGERAKFNLAPAPYPNIDDGSGVIAEYGDGVSILSGQISFYSPGSSIEAPSGAAIRIGESILGTSIYNGDGITLSGSSGIVVASGNSASQFIGAPYGSGGPMTILATDGPALDLGQGDDHVQVSSGSTIVGDALFGADNDLLQLSDGILRLDGLYDGGDGLDTVSFVGTASTLESMTSVVDGNVATVDVGGLWSVQLTGWETFTFADGTSLGYDDFLAATVASVPVETILTEMPIEFRTPTAPIENAVILEGSPTVFIEASLGYSTHPATALIGTGDFAALRMEAGTRAFVTESEIRSDSVGIRMEDGAEIELVGVPFDTDGAGIVAGDNTVIYADFGEWVSGGTAVEVGDGSNVVFNLSTKVTSGGSAAIIAGENTSLHLGPGAEFVVSEGDLIRLQSGELRIGYDTERSVANGAIVRVGESEGDLKITFDRFGSFSASEDGRISALEGIIVDSANTARQSIFSTGPFSIIATGGPAFDLGRGDDLLQLAAGISITGASLLGSGNDLLQLGDGMGLLADIFDGGEGEDTVEFTGPLATLDAIRSTLDGDTILLEVGDDWTISLTGWENFLFADGSSLGLADFLAATAPVQAVPLPATALLLGGTLVGLGLTRRR